VTLAAACEAAHNGTLEGVPFYNEYGPADVMPWSVRSYWCGTNAMAADDRIIAVELL
jgi:hypothetical protein